MSTKEKLIEEIDRWITSLIEASSAERYSKEELAAVREGYALYKSWDTVTQEEANKMFNEWLKNK